MPLIIRCSRDIHSSWTVLPMLATQSILLNWRLHENLLFSGFPVRIAARSEEEDNSSDWSVPHKYDADALNQRSTAIKAQIQLGLSIVFGLIVCCQKKCKYNDKYKYKHKINKSFELGLLACGLPEIQLTQSIRPLLSDPCFKLNFTFFCICIWDFVFLLLYFFFFFLEAQRPVDSINLFTLIQPLFED